MKFIIRGKWGQKREQFTRNTLDRAIGIAENSKSSTIYEKRKTGLFPIMRCRQGTCKRVSINEQLRNARKHAIR